VDAVNKRKISWPAVQPVTISTEQSQLLFGNMGRMPRNASKIIISSEFCFS
jgi:hypothetical protein